MKGKFCVNRRLFRLLLVARLIPILIGISSLPTSGMAQEPPQQQEHQQPGVTQGQGAEPIVVSIKDLQKHPENYYGKKVTVDGKMHWNFTNNVFTIRGRGKDVLVISVGPKSESTVPLNLSGRRVRVTGVVQPYDRAKLESEYGPLHLEPREGRSYVKNPVIIMDNTQRPQTALIITLQKPSPVPEPPAAKPAPPPEPSEQQPPATESAREKPSMPKTAGNLPLLALAGLCSLGGALVKRLKG